MDLKFCALYAHMSSDEENAGDVKRIGSMHPQAAMKELGISYESATPEIMVDRWIFHGCTNIPEKLPPFLTEFSFYKKAAK